MQGSKSTHMYIIDCRNLTPSQAIVPLRVVCIVWVEVDYYTCYLSQNHSVEILWLCLNLLCVVCIGLYICQVGWETWLNSASPCRIGSCHLILLWRGSPTSWTSFSGEHHLICAPKTHRNHGSYISSCGVHAHFRHPLSQVQRLQYPPYHMMRCGLYHMCICMVLQAQPRNKANSVRLVLISVVVIDCCSSCLHYEFATVANQVSNVISFCIFYRDVESPDYDSKGWPPADGGTQYKHCFFTIVIHVYELILNYRYVVESSTCWLSDGSSPTVDKLGSQLQL